jgi:spermidine synthase
MSAEILTIFTLQIFFGYIYHYIGLIVTIFLAGLLPGALFAEKLKQKGFKLLRLSDLLLALLLLVFLLCLQIIAEDLPLFFFFIFGLIASIICGFQFPVALAIQGKSNSSISRVFSADLIGAAVGSLLPSTVLIPTLGVFWTGISIAGVKLFSFFITGKLSPSGGQEG